MEAAHNNIARTMTSDNRLSLNKTGPLLLILSGPSGVGKDAVFNRMKQLELPYHYAITATTRPIRPTEQDGIDYHFFTKDEFKRKIAEKQLLEWAKVYDNYYGVPKEEVEPALKRGQDVIVKVDVQGAATLKRLFPKAIAIFLMYPSEEELAQRLKHRGSESQKDLDRRLKTVEAEMKSLPFFDYVVVNYKDKLDETAAQIESIIKTQKGKAKQKKR